MKFVITAVVFLMSLPAFSCNLGPGESALSIQRVMRNFGPAIMRADMAALNGVQSATSVDDAQINAAITGLNEAISCADAVLDDPSGPLLPSKIHEITEADRPAYIKKFLDDMSHFRSGLVEYRNIFRDLLKLPLATRTYSAARSKSQDVQDRARAAHSDLG